MILYIENTKNTTRKLPELISEFRKVAGYKINIQKPVVFLYVNNELSERAKEIILFTTASKRIKYLGINLPKEAKVLYLGNCKTLIEKKLKMTQLNRKIYYVFGLGELILLKYHTSQGNLQIQCNPYQNTTGTELE